MVKILVRLCGISMYTLKDALTGLRKRRGVIVYAGGAYDVLHIGHVRYLTAAKKLGDFLVVGIGNDRLVRSRKGSGRPIVSEQQRAEMIDALKPVDYVFVASTVHYDVQLIKQIKPDVLVLPAEKTVLPELRVVARAIQKKFPALKIVFLHSGVRGLVSTTKLVKKIKATLL